MAEVSVSLNKYSFFIGSAFLEIKNPNLFPTEKKVPVFEAYLESHWKETEMVVNSKTYLHRQISQQLLVLNFPCSYLNYTYRYFFSEATCKIVSHSDVEWKKHVPISLPYTT